MSEELKFTSETEAMQHLANITGKQIKVATDDKPEVIEVKDGEWANILKDPNIKNVSMVGGRDGADYEIIFNDKTSKLYKFASIKIGSKETEELAKEWTKADNATNAFFVWAREQGATKETLQYIVDAQTAMAKAYKLINGDIKAKEKFI